MHILWFLLDIHNFENELADNTPVISLQGQWVLNHAAIKTQEQDRVLDGAVIVGLKMDDVKKCQPHILFQCQSPQVEHSLALDSSLMLYMAGPWQLIGLDLALD